MPTDIAPSPGSLYTRTKVLLNNDPRSLPTIFKESGIPFYWLKKFSAGEIAQPSVNTVQRLYEFLTQRKLSVR